jgi:hypothetical protein
MTNLNISQQLHSRKTVKKNAGKGIAGKTQLFDGMNRRTGSPSQTLLLLLHLFQHASSLSSHSPPDPLAYPKYSVSLSGWDDAINNHTATAILSNLQSESKDDAVSILNYNSFSQVGISYLHFEVICPS